MTALTQYESLDRLRAAAEHVTAAREALRDAIRARDHAICHAIDEDHLDRSDVAIITGLSNPSLSRILWNAQPASGR